MEIKNILSTVDSDDLIGLMETQDVDVLKNLLEVLPGLSGIELSRALFAISVFLIRDLPTQVVQRIIDECEKIIKKSTSYDALSGAFRNLDIAFRMISGKMSSDSRSKVKDLVVELSLVESLPFIKERALRLLEDERLWPETSNLDPITEALRLAPGASVETIVERILALQEDICILASYCSECDPTRISLLSTVHLLESDVLSHIDFPD